jgi:sugar phosphate isomerase/epimerase
MRNNHPLMQQLVCSPACIPSMPYDELLEAYSKLGFTKIEAFSEWAESRLNWREDPALAREMAQNFGIAITSFHLPLIKADDVEEGLTNAIDAARYADGVGAKVVLFKAGNREVFEQIGKRFLDALDEQQIGVTPVVQNHKGTAITSTDDYEDVFARVGHDPQLKGVLEVGHFHRVGVSWKEGWDYLGDRIALIHINDIRDGNSVHYGTGEVDFAGLLRQIKSSSYGGEIVVELELETRRTDPPATLAGLKDAIRVLTELYSQN